MPGKAWIDPRSIDYTDGLNPLRIPGFAELNSPYVYRVLNGDAWHYALRFAKGIEPRCYVGPDPMQQLIQPGATINYEVPAEPNLWIWAVNASSDDEDFLFNVADSETGAQFFSTPISMSSVNAALNGTAHRGPLFFMATPHLFTPPAYPIVRITNTSGAAQVCRVNLFGGVEYDI